MSSNLNTDDDIVPFIQRTLSKVKHESDIQQLNADRKLFRKHVPFGMRSYFASYLIRMMYQGDSSWRFESKKRSIPKISVDASVSTTLFFNIGKLRKVFYRDIISLIIRSCDVKREDIGEIKIYDNYSFVQVANEVKDIIIEKLANTTYRGKVLVVSVANEKHSTSERS